MKRILLLTLFFCFKLQANSIPYKPYIIKVNDNISDILNNFQYSPLFGKNQWVEKVLKLNRLTYKSAKKLDVGDVIILPMEAKVFSKIEYQDEIKTLQSSWEKSKLIEYLSPRKHNVQLNTNVFNRSYKLKNESVDIRQGFALSANYKNRNIDSAENILFNKSIGLAIYTQSNADFESDSSKVAEFTPSYILNAAFEVENKEYGIGLSTILENEMFSALSGKNNVYQVATRNIFWSGLEASKYINFKNNSYKISGYYLIGANTENFSRKINASLKSFIKQHYVVDIYYNQYSFNFSEEVSAQDTGFSVGYRF